MQILLAAASSTAFTVIIADSRPLCDGVKSLKVLSKVVKCIYVPLSGAASAMKDVTRVLLGSSAVFSNGAMLAVSGTGACSYCR